MEEAKEVALKKSVCHNFILLFCIQQVYRMEEAKEVALKKSVCHMTKDMRDTSRYEQCPTNKTIAWISRCKKIFRACNTQYSRSFRIYLCGMAFMQRRNIH